ncbi:hypothetical protein [Nocardiopsis sp. CC223A]|uniref:hypothetical protein n=1 Tax=Nocardiopsis sp. CC223A TaxID=3044051 RepID=UPI00278C1A3F|nr:hypothetical protein [Nocardiopsis sp. CC223A]
MDDPVHGTPAREIELDVISFDFGDPGLVTRGLTACGTSLGTDEYLRLSVWNKRLSPLVAPVFPGGEPHPGYRYLRVPEGTGEGALLRRFPTTGDGRRSAAQAVVGAELRMRQALFAALGGWPDLHAWLESPAHRLQDWAAMPPYLGRMDEKGRRQARRFDLEAVEQEDLPLLVALLLRSPDSPVDIPVPTTGPLARERDRLVLLWGVYGVLRDILGTERQRPGRFNDWSFCTCEPGPPPAVGRPRFSFHIEPAGDTGPWWSEEPEDQYLELAGWLVTQLRRKDQGFLPRLREYAASATVGHHERLIEELLEQVPVQRSAVVRPPVPSAADPAVGPETVPDGDPDPDPVPAPSAPEPRPLPGPTVRPRPAFPHPGPAREQDPRPRPPLPHRDSGVPDRWNEDAWREELHRLSAQLSVARDPDLVGDLATRIVRLHQPDFGRDLKVGGASLGMKVPVPTWVLYLVAVQVLLLVCFLLVLSGG